MKHLLASTCLVAGLLAMTGAARAECGDVTIASMNWQSAEVLAALDKFILSEGYGCNAEVIVGDTVPTITSMIEKGEPDLAPEGWVDLLPDVVKRGIDEGKLVGAAVALSDGAVQGWWIPKYVAEAHPDIKIHLNQNLISAPHIRYRHTIYYAHLFAHPRYGDYVGGAEQEWIEAALRLRP